MNRNALRALSALILFFALAAGSLMAQVDVNHADYDELRSLPGVDAYLAGRILDARPFRNKTQVKAIVGPAVYERIRLHIVALEKEALPEASRPVDANRASREELLSVKGIGDKTADIIMGNRPFRSMDDLRRVLNPTVFTKVRDMLFVSDPYGSTDPYGTTGDEPSFGGAEYSDDYSTTGSDQNTGDYDSYGTTVNDDPYGTSGNDHRPAPSVNYDALGSGSGLYDTE